ncbi:trna guanine-n-methyltransferase [Pelomyxa schiedti]|nr:trna guanine-n-methyltransferase [Pelomyxa schiedti]
MASKAPTPKTGRTKSKRLHAHSNPLADKFFAYPTCPDAADWPSIFPALLPTPTPTPTPTPSSSASAASTTTTQPPPTPLPQQPMMMSTARGGGGGGEGEGEGGRAWPFFVDIGCGFGGLTVALGTAYPDCLTLAMEIRVRVVEGVQERITKLRADNPGQYQNIACIACNCMKNLPHWFHKGRCDKLFILFPDPHFKQSKKRLRIISPMLLSEYAYILREGGMLYTNTDVEDLHKWMVQCLDEHPMFERIPPEQLADDKAYNLIHNVSEESLKVARAGGRKFPAVYRRLPTSQCIPRVPPLFS